MVFFRCSASDQNYTKCSIEFFCSQQALWVSAILSVICLSSSFSHSHVLFLFHIHAYEHALSLSLSLPTNGSMRNTYLGAIFLLYTIGVEQNLVYVLLLLCKKMNAVTYCVASSMAAALEYYGDEAATETVRMFDRFFDCLNTHHSKGQCKRKPNLLPHVYV